jgi:uncharacterized protein DUF3558
VRRSFLLVPAVVVLVGGLAACSDKATGQPVAQSPTNTQPGSGGPFPTGQAGTTSSEPSVAAGPLKGVSPCSLLSAAEVADLQAGPSKETTVNGSRGCDFEKGQGYALSVSIWDELGLDRVVATGGIKSVPDVGSHKAVQAKGGIDACIIAVEVTKTSRVDSIVTTTDGNDQKSCDLALQVAKLVEPRLPR